jgi:hypothetical protein
MAHWFTRLSSFPTPPNPPVPPPCYSMLVNLARRIWYDMIWYDMIWYDMIWYDMIWYDMIWFKTLKYLKLGYPSTSGLKGRRRTYHTIFKLSSGFNSPFRAVSENPLILARLLSLWVLGKVFFCLSEKSVSEREVRTHNVGTNYSVQEWRASRPEIC